MLTRIRAVVARYTLTYGTARGLWMRARRSLRVEQRTVVRIKEQGFDQPIWIRSGSSDELVVAQVFGKLDYEIPYQIEPTTIVDAGANIGLASLYLARRFPTARILAIEPGLENFKLLERNTVSHANNSAVCAALWSHSGAVQVVDPGIGEWGLRTTATEVEIDPTETTLRASEVPTLTARDTMDRLDVERLGLLEIDIEGAESEVFSHADTWIYDVDSILVQLHDTFRPGCPAIFEEATKDFDHRDRRGENRYVSR